MTVERDRQRYLDAAHAVQSGIAMLEHTNPRLFEPKHARVGIDTAKVEHGGLVTLLMSKGLFTEAEYIAAMADAMEAEQQRSEAELGCKLV
jgi:hypothetical protein